MGIYGDQRLNYVVRPRRSGQMIGWFMGIGLLVGLLVVGKFYLDKNQGALDSLLGNIQKQYHALVTSSGSTALDDSGKASRFNKDHILLIKDLRYKVLELGTYFHDEGRGDYLVSFEKINKDFSASMDRLMSAKDMVPLDDNISKRLAELEKSWNSMGNEVRLMLENYPLRKKFAEAVSSVHKISAEMVVQNNKLLDRLTRSKMSKGQFRLLGRQNYHLQSIQTQTSILLSSGLEMSTPSERLGEGMTNLAKVYEGLLSGSRAYGVKRLRNASLRRDVKKIVVNLKKLQEQISYIMDISPDIYEIRERQQKLQKRRNTLLSEVNKLVKDYGNS